MFNWRSSSCVRISSSVNRCTGGAKGLVSRHQPPPPPPSSIPSGAPKKRDRDEESPRRGWSDGTKKPPFRAYSPVFPNPLGDPYRRTAAQRTGSGCNAYAVIIWEHSYTYSPVLSLRSSEPHTVTFDTTQPAH